MKPKPTNIHYAKRGNKGYKATEVLTRVLEICNPGPGRIQKASILRVYTGRIGLQTHAERWGAKPPTFFGWVWGPVRSVEMAETLVANLQNLG